MTELLVWAFLAAVGAGSVLWALGAARKAGREQERSEGRREVIDAIQDKEALGRELDNPDARRRLREESYRD